MRAAEIAARRAASLLRGGMPASRLWLRLGAEASENPQFSEIAAGIEAGQSIPEALARGGDPAWRVLAAAWAVAERSGAAFVPTLDRLAAALHALERLSERRSVLLAGPRSTIRLVVALPPVSLLLSALLGFDPWPVLITPLGLLVTSLGVLLLVLGARWAQSLVAKIASRDTAGGLTLELLAIALQGGASIGESLRVIADCADQAQAEWIDLSELRRDGIVQRTVETAATLGAPLGQLLIAAANTARSESATELERETERLAVRVLIPLGVCILPAFILLGVLPVLISMLGGIGFAG